jgi:ubiquinone/menaquinone biosynthesis C-methylase UbiE
VITDRGEAMFALQQTLYTSRNPTRRTLHCTRRDWMIDAIGRYGTGVRRALEVGPGSGVYLPTLTSTARHVVALDIESAYLDRLVDMRCEHDTLQLVRDDITRSSFADGSFELVVCSEVVEHIRDSTAALREMRRILVDDGTLILSTPQRYSTLEVASAVAFMPGFIQLARRVYKEAVIKAGHINLLTRRKLREQLAISGFVPVEEWVSGMYLPGVAEALGTRALSIQAAFERKIRGTPLEHALWTQFVVARPSAGGRRVREGDLNSDRKSVGR